MRRSSVSALVLVAAGLATRAAVRHLARRRRAAEVAARPSAAPASAVAPATPATAAPVVDAVVLPFPRRPEPAPVQPAAPARCGETGGRTKAGAPCGARAASGGRCHHHRVAA